MNTTDGEKLVVRVTSSAGRSRLVVKADSTLAELKKEIEKHIKVPPDRQNVSLDRQKKPLVGDKLSLRKLGITDGDVLFVSTGDFQASIDGQQLSSATLKADSSAASSNSGSSNCSSSSASASSFAPEASSCAPSVVRNGASGPSDGSIVSNKDMRRRETSGFHKGDAKEPTFKSFDCYLKERGYNVNDLPFKRSYQPTLLTKGALNKVPLSLSLKHQPYRHVDHLELMNVEEVKGFVNYWRYELDMIEQRGGWMYGYYKEDFHYPLGIRAVCEAIYEPPQVSNGACVEFLADKDLAAADQIAESLGLERIGWIFTHLPRDEMLTAEEVVRIAKLQLQTIKDTHFSRYPMSKFVTCTVSLEAKSGGGEPVPNAFMVADMGMALVRDGLVVKEQPDLTHIQLRPPSSGELLPEILEGGHETSRFDADWFVVRVNESAPIKVRSIFRNSANFPCENRKTPQEHTHVKAYLNAASSASSTASSNWLKFANFHLLLFIAKLFDIETAVSIAASVANQTPVDAGLEDILKSFA